MFWFFEMVRFHYEITGFFKKRIILFKEKSIFSMSKISCIVTFIFLTVKHKKKSWHCLKHCSFLFYKNIQMKTSDPDIFMYVALNVVRAGSTTSGTPSFSSIFSLTLTCLSLLSLLSYFSSIFTPPLFFISFILV